MREGPLIRRLDIGGVRYATQLQRVKATGRAAAWGWLSFSLIRSTPPRAVLELVPGSPPSSQRLFPNGCTIAFPERAE
jgi:hypothetical protein